jgi:Animal haem peroxidase
MIRTLRRRGWKYAVSLWAATHLYWLWDFINRTDLLHALVNESIINRFVAAMEPRPARLSTMSDYTSWDSLIDKTFSDRHLPPTPRRYPPPALNEVVDLFRRPAGQQTEAEKSTLLFPFFAQWFVDGFLRTDPTNPLRNTSTHEIDLSQLYSSDPRVTDALRAHVGGRLKSEWHRRTDGVEEEYPPWYYDSDGDVKVEFRDVPIIVPDGKGPNQSAHPAHPTYHSPTDHNLFALGLPRGNIHYGTALMSTIFLREHNRLAGLIANDNAHWDDERIFQTARNTLIVMLIKLVIQDYINHITPFRFQFDCDPGTGALRDWFRPNWMSIEFDMLYRWHALVPDHIDIDGVNTDYATLLWDVQILIDHGVASLVDQASRQPCTEIGLFNTADFLITTVEQPTIEMGRAANLASFNDYRQACGYPRLTSFDDISSCDKIRSRLRDVYGDIEAVELYPGLYAEDVETDGVLGDLMGTMVGVDAFSQALTNPLLDPRLFSPETFSRVGMAEIGQTNYLQDIVLRNIPPGIEPLVTFNRHPPPPPPLRPLPRPES